MKDLGHLITVAAAVDVRLALPCFDRLTVLPAQPETADHSAWTTCFALCPKPWITL
jgi:hypothetical protein